MVTVRLAPAAGGVRRLGGWWSTATATVSMGTGRGADAARGEQHAELSGKAGGRAMCTCRATVPLCLPAMCTCTRAGAESHGPGASHLLSL
jgi:hypothetical protein